MKYEYPLRINRYLALNNYATRLGADELIKKGLVFINGHQAVLGDKVNEEDKIEVRTKNIPNHVYYAYNKKKGITTNPEKDSRDILKVTRFPTKVFPIGRLDKDSRGLIIMTNDGRITDRLLSPKYTHEKEYVVTTEKEVTDGFIENMSNGVRFDGYVSKPCEVWRKKKNVFHIILTEGKKRQIRRMCEALYHKVEDLRRIRVGNIQIGKIPEGEYREIKGQELTDFLTALKIL